MVLPSLNTPVYVKKIPSTGKDFKFRPFLIKEEKALLLAAQDDTKKSIGETIKQIIQNCTFDNLNIDNLPFFDVEYIFLQIRIKSNGSLIPVTYECEKCKTKNSFEIDISDASVVFKEDVDKTIILDNERQIGIVMKYPTFSGIIETFESIEKNKNILEYTHLFIESVFEGENVVDDFTNEELSEFIESLTKDQYMKIKEFMENVPKLRKDIEHSCENCGNVKKTYLEGLQSFLV